VRIPVWGRGKSGKPPGWEQVHKQVIKYLGKIPEWGRGINLKTSTCEQEQDSKGFCENSRLGKGISGKAPGFIRETYSRLEFGQ
jgi:hypothetical protein